MAFNSLMHDRNIYKNRPDFAKIALDFPEFRKYALADSKGKVRVDFNNPDALRILTKILLKKDFNLSVEIPKGFLIPTVPQRLNYILWVEDLLTVLPSVNKIPYGIDIGCGPCAIFSLLGAKKNNWKFVSTESSEESLQWALRNINSNNLNSLIKVVKVSSDGTLNELLSSNEDVYDFCLCNPPFFDNIDEIRKKNTKTKGTIASIAKQEEIFAEGGEVAFVKRIIDESFLYKDRIRLYTSMFGKKKSFVEIWKTLQNVEDISLSKSQFCQGNTIRWGIAWTFLKSVSFDKLEKPNPKKNKKPKPPLVHQVPKNIKGIDYNVQALSEVILKILRELEIAVKVVRSYEHYIESLIASDKNTWSHQRRKRREMGRNVDTNNPCSQASSNSSSVIPDESCEILALKDKEKSCHLSVQNKPEENCFIERVDFEAELKSEAKKRKLSETQPDSQKKFCSDFESTKSDESPNLLKLNKEYEANLSDDKLKDFCSESKSIKLSETQFRSNIKLEIDSKEHEMTDKNSEPSDECSNNCKVVKQSDEEMNLKVLGNKDHQQQTERKKVSNQSVKKVNLNDSKSLTDFKFEAKSLLFSTLKIRKAKELVLVEMNCLPEANRETMYQIFQYLKNKLQGIP